MAELAIVVLLAEPSGHVAPSRWVQHVADGDRTLCGVDLGQSVSELGGELPAEERDLVEAADRCQHKACARAWERAAAVAA